MEALRTYDSEDKEVCPAKDDEDKTNEPTQWLPGVGRKFIPMARTIPEIPAGMYTIKFDRETGTYCLFLQDLHLDDLIVLPDKVMEGILNDIRCFWKLQESYKNHKYIYKRGILLYGAPGCGKTSVIMLLAKELINDGGIVVNICDFGGNAEGIETTLSTFRRVEPGRRLIVIIEDIDNYMREADGSLTELLNFLDGGLQLPNIVVLATTNYPERLQKRISHRPSRFDRRYEIGLPSDAAREYYIKCKLSEEDFKKASLKTLVEKSRGFTIDHLKELILSVCVLGYGLEEAHEEIRGMLGSGILRNTSDQIKTGFAVRDTSESE